jgi:N-acetylated-alpha-linked acidic dipeptidase
MLESVHGIGELLKSGWKPKRTIVFASWDAEEEGLIGSTEWAEDNERALSQAVAYFNMDTGASGANFRASAVGSLKQFVRDLAKVIPAPQGGVVYDVWRLPRPRENEPTPGAVPEQTPTHNAPTREPNVGSLGSGSDYSPFLQHLGVPATDVRSSGDYGVYHSVFDNFAWYTKFGDPDFKYTQEMARVFGLEVLRMADADVLPYDYETYGKDITGFLEAAQRRAQQTFGGKAPTFTAALDAARRFTAAGTAMLKTQNTPKRDSAALNRTLMGVERALLIPAGLPKRPWYKHAIYAPGRYTGYEAVVIPGVNESIDQNDVLATEEGLAAVTAALDRAARVLSTR